MTRFETDPNARVFKLLNISFGYFPKGGSGMAGLLAVYHSEKGVHLRVWRLCVGIRKPIAYKDTWSWHWPINVTLE